MIFNFLSKKKRSGIFTEFATQSFSEAVKTGVAALLQLVFHSTTWGVILSVGVKGVVDSLFVKASQLENKIDKLLQLPMLSGITFLQHALLNDGDSAEEIAGRQKLLDFAHIEFVKAYHLSVDSQEDKTFIFALDCLTLAANKGQKTLAEKLSKECKEKIDEYEKSAGEYESAMKTVIERGRRTEVFLYGASEWTDKPHGFAEQKMAWKSFLKEVKKIKEKIANQKSKIEILKNLHEMSLGLIRANV